MLVSQIRARSGFTDRVGPATTQILGSSEVGCTGARRQQWALYLIDDACVRLSRSSDADYMGARGFPGDQDSPERDAWTRGSFRHREADCCCGPLFPRGKCGGFGKEVGVSRPTSYASKNQFLGVQAPATTRRKKSADLAPEIEELERQNAALHAHIHELQIEPDPFKSNPSRWAKFTSRRS